MIEIVFSDSAGGSLKVAQSYGKGKYQEEASSFEVIGIDDNEITPEKYEKQFSKFWNQERKEWENSRPLGGNSADVFSFELMLDIGDISEDIPDSKRKEVIRGLWSMYPGDTGIEAADEVIYNAKSNLEYIKKRVLDGEPIRIWYSAKPSELCGFYWFMSQLASFSGEPSEIYLVKLSDFYSDDNGNINTLNGWSEATASLYSRSLYMQQTVSFEFCQSCKVLWNEHKEENSPLRAVINGQLTGVSIDFYDRFIINESIKFKDEYSEGKLIGSVMSLYQFGIHDSFISKRIDAMTDRGLISVVGDGEKDSLYSRILRKRS